MTEQSNFGSRARRGDQPQRGSFSPRLVLMLIAVALAAIVGVYASIPMKQNQTATAPDPTSLAISDLQTSQRKAVDQLKALEETVSSDRAEMKRLSDQVSALTGKLEALQQSFAGAPQAPVLQPTERKAEARRPLTR
jgi:uncharacterized protein HemX